MMQRARRPFFFLGIMKFLMGCEKSVSNRVGGWPVDAADR